MKMMTPQTLALKKKVKISSVGAMPPTIVKYSLKLSTKLLTLTFKTFMIILKQAKLAEDPCSVLIN